MTACFQASERAAVYSRHSDIHDCPQRRIDLTWSGNPITLPNGRGCQGDREIGYHGWGESKKKRTHARIAGKALFSRFTRSRKWNETTVWWRDYRKWRLCREISFRGLTCRTCCSGFNRHPQTLVSVRFRFALSMLTFGNCITLRGVEAALMPWSISKLLQISIPQPPRSLIPMSGFLIQEEIYAVERKGKRWPGLIQQLWPEADRGSSTLTYLLSLRRADVIIPHLVINPSLHFYFLCSPENHSCCIFFFFFLSFLAVELTSSSFSLCCSKKLSHPRNLSNLSCGELDINFLSIA